MTYLPLPPSESPRARRHPALALLLCVLAGLLPALATAQGTTIYRCTDASGELTVQNKPCPAGSTQRQQQVQGVSSAPAAVAPAAAAPMSANVPPPAATLPVTPASTPGAAAAPVETIYRCTDASGNLTVQNLPCPSGTTQREQRVQGVSSTPAATALPPAATAPQPGSGGEFTTTSTGPEPRILDSANLPRTPLPTAGEPDPDRLPPPPLFRCTTYDSDSYLSEEPEQPPRCLRLRTVGLDGNPAGGAGQACEVVRDECARVADGGACEAWHRYAREAESRLRFAHPDNVERRRAEYERLAAIVTESCGG